VEAVIDFRFSPEVNGTDLLVALVRAVGEKYAGEPKKQERLEFHASVQEDSVATTARRSPHLSFIQSGDELRLLGCGDGMLSMHALAPYPGWDAFIQRFPDCNARQTRRDASPTYRIPLRDADG
jgi:uncharacterized protein (TIGR04255 family)